jgi:cell division protein FtsX
MTTKELDAEIIRVQNIKDAAVMTKKAAVKELKDKLSSTTSEAEVTELENRISALIVAKDAEITTFKDSLRSLHVDFEKAYAIERSSVSVGPSADIAPKGIASGESVKGIGG